MELSFIGEFVAGGLHSASAMEVLNNRIYIAGDSLTWIYEFSSSFALLSKIPVQPNQQKGEEAKAVKRDWECMAVIGNQLLIAGSGSVVGNRDHAVLLNPATQVYTEIAHWPALYSSLRSMLAPGDELNIEGLTALGNYLLLASRGSLSSANYFFLVPQTVVNAPTNEIKMIHSAPADIKGVKAGFTGLFYIDDIDTLVYTAAAEAVDNAYDDGEVVGSAIGCINNISALTNASNWQPDSQILLTDELSGKVESITVLEKLDNKYVCLAVTDNDGKPGSIYKFTLGF